MISDAQDYDTFPEMTVYDIDGNKVGQVGQLYMSDETNQPAWVTVDTGLFGTSQSFVPLKDAAIQGDRIQVPYEKSYIKKAPRIDNEGTLHQSDEEELYRYYRIKYSDTDIHDHGVDVHDHAVDRDVDFDGTAIMTAAEERLNVGTEQVEAGRARLRKYVTTEQQTITVPVEKEVLRVEREAVTGDTRRTRIGEDDEVEDIVLREERPVVSKEVHETERVRVGKETITEPEQVSGEVKKEHIEVEEDLRRDDDRRI